MGTLVFQATLGGSVNLIGPNTASTINFTLPSADGTSGQALATNGSGTLAFSSFATLVSNTFTGSQTLSAGTANGVTYLNGSKVLTSGSALTFDGSSLATAGTFTASGAITATGATQGAVTIQKTGTLAYSLYSDAAGTLKAYNNNAGFDALTLNNAGNLGLGVTPASWATYKAFDIGYAGNGLHATGQNDLNLASNVYYNAGYKYAGSARANLLEMYNGQFYFKTAGSGTAGNAITFTDAMTLDASGNLMLGSTTASGLLYLQSSSNPYLRMGYGGANALNEITWDSADFVISADRSNAVTSSLIFKNDGTERARITANGFFKASDNGTYVNGSGSYYELRSSVSNTQTVQIHNAGTSGQQYGLLITTANDQNDGTRYFLSCEGGAGTVRAKFLTNGGLANYSANNSNLSDRREKTNFAPAKSYLDVICSIPVQTYKYIDQSDDELTLGVVAQDVQAVAPELVTEGNWGTLEEPKMRLSIYQTDLQYALMKCIQEQQAIIETLKARLDAANL